MWKRASTLAIFAGVVWGASAVAQTPDASSWKLEMRTLAPTSGAGLSNGPLIDRDGIRIVRVDLEPGSIRLVHTHDDVRYHLLVPVTGPVQVNLGETTHVPLQQWQPHFFPGGTRHGFQNNGATKLSVMEIFVK